MTVRQNRMQAHHIEARIRLAYQPTYLKVVDDSARHVGHAGARPQGQSHFSVVIVANCFEGMARLARHRQVMALFSTELKGEIHALAIEALTPAEWKSRAPSTLD